MSRLITTTLLYGIYGSGKSGLAISSFWDWVKQEPREGRIGRLMNIGSEDSDALTREMPEEMIKRYPIDPDKPLKFAKDAVAFLKSLTAKLMKAKALSSPPPITDLVFDGISEYNTYFISQTEEMGVQGYDIYKEWKDEYFKILVPLLKNLKYLGCNVFVTAHVTERKKGTYNKRTGKTEGESPEALMPTEFHPDIDGKPKYKVGHLFDFVVYMKEEGSTKLVGGRREVETDMLSFWLGGGDFAVKNVYKHLWRKEDAILKNAMWEDVERIFEGFAEEGKG